MCKKTTSFVVLFGCCVSSSANLVIADDKLFYRKYELYVRPHIPGTPRPEEMLEARFVLPHEYKINRSIGQNKGVVITDKNLGGLDERYWDIQECENGVVLKWKVRNSEAFPLGGRTASLVLQLAGDRQDKKMRLSDRYIRVRDRFFSDFYFDGAVAASLTEGATANSQKRKVVFGDQTMYVGYAIAALATESFILRDAGQNDDDSRRRLKEMLNSFDDLDYQAEALYGAPKMLNGFFVRDNIKGIEDARLKRRFGEVQSDWSSPQDASPSGDQIFGMMFGLYCVHVYVDDKEIVSQARAIAKRVYDYARRCRFELKLPSNRKNNRGADMQWTCSLLHGLQNDITGHDLFSESPYEIAGVLRPMKDIGAAWDSRVVQKLIVSKCDADFDLPIGGFRVKVNSFALNLMLMAIAPTDVWSQETIESAAVKCNHQLSTLVNCGLHNRLPIEIQREKISDLLSALPPDGPSSFPNSNGWGHDNRWVRCNDSASPGNERYNGLDWMLLHNFEQIVYVGPPTPSPANKNDRNQSSIPPNSARVPVIDKRSYLYGYLLMQQGLIDNQQTSIHNHLIK